MYYYPLAGKVTFYQPQDKYWEDVTIIVEYLIHADGLKLNTTDSHRWAIHEFPPTKDFFDWQNRCFSAGNIIDHTKTYAKSKSGCETSELSNCLLGSLSFRQGTLTISGTTVNGTVSRKLFVDSKLSMSGQNSIIGKSLVIYDDVDTRNRGDRLACTRYVNKESS